MSSSRTIPFAIVLGGLLIAWAVYSSMGGAWPPFNLGGAAHGDPSLVHPVGVDDHILGNPAAPVMVVVYCDFESEYCKGFVATLEQLVATEGADGEVAVVYRAYPLAKIHPNALTHAYAAECAARVGGNESYLRFADALYATQPADPSQYGALAEKALVLNRDAFATCYADAASQVGARIEADRQNALDVGASGTPYSLVLAKGPAGWRAPIVVDGAYTYDALKQVVEQALGHRQ